MAKCPDFVSVLAAISTPAPLFSAGVHAASGSEGGRRKSSLLTFGTFGHAKVRERKSIFKVFLIKRLLIRHASRATFLAVARSRSGSDSPRGCHSFPSRRFATHRRRLPIRFFFCHRRRKRKSYQKENAEQKFRALRSATKAPRLPRLGDDDTHASHMCQSP